MNTLLTDHPAEAGWPALTEELQTRGSAVLPQLLTPAQCTAMTGLYQQNALFRSRVVMARHGFGQGESQYFSYPLPALVQQLRGTLYPRLVDVANR